MCESVLRGTVEIRAVVLHGSGERDHCRNHQIKDKTEFPRLAHALTCIVIVTTGLMSDETDKRVNKFAALSLRLSIVHSLSSSLTVSLRGNFSSFRFNKTIGVEKGRSGGGGGRREKKVTVFSEIIIYKPEIRQVRRFASALS